MDIYVNNKLNPQAFEMTVRRGTHDLNDLLLAAAKTQSALVETTHVLIALGKISGGYTQKEIGRYNLSADLWEEGLLGCAEKVKGSLPVGDLSVSSLHATAKEAFGEAEKLCRQYQLALISEPALLLAALRHATPAVHELFESADIDVPQWCQRIEETLKPVTPVAVFEGETVNLESFSPKAKKVLGLLRQEAESLGYATADPRHLLLALVEHESGPTPYGIFNQGMTPRKVQEAVMLSLRSRAKRTRSQLPLERRFLQPILQQILARSGEIAGRAHSEKIAEPHLLLAFLQTESAARRIVEDEKLNLTDLVRIAEEYDLSQEDEEDFKIADIETVRRRLRDRLVGQEDAIDRILPYVQRMRFGFTTPGRPVGVFLFCGQSGSGKTEMAKGLAKAVYGSEENLIFLEMGQFNAPESMNIFVGAPPGYIGYGEGKLTNGLRDKPQSVVLFDEVEKAHTRVLDALLRFLDEGKVDDPAGPVRDGSQCIIILTSNVGAEELSRLWAQLENDPNWRSRVRKELREEFQRNHFRVEFLNRVDELILFRTLKVSHYVEIADRLIRRDLERLRKERRIDVADYKGVAEAIGAYCATINEGAREAQRLTQSMVITPVIDFVLRKNCSLPVRLQVRPVVSTGDPAAEPSGQVDLA